MKKFILLCAATALFASCSKTQTQYIVVPHHDTVQSTPKTITGNWSTTQGGHTQQIMYPSFTTDSMTLWGRNYRYTATSDTIYKFYSPTTLEAVFYYQLTSGGDSLYLMPVFSMDAPATYFRH